MRSVLGKRLLGSVGALLGVLGVVNVVLTVYLRLREGRGMEVYTDFYGQHETWAGYAGYLVGGSLMLLGFFLVRWYQLWRRSRQDGPSGDALGKQPRRREP